jgi:hypothetical protein
VEAKLFDLQSRNSLHRSSCIFTERWGPGAMGPRDLGPSFQRWQLFPSKKNRQPKLRKIAVNDLGAKVECLYEEAKP